MHSDRLVVPKIGDLCNSLALTAHTDAHARRVEKQKQANNNKLASSLFYPQGYFIRRGIVVSPCKSLQLW